MRTGEFCVSFHTVPPFFFGKGLLYVLMEALNYNVVLPGADESSTCRGQAKSFCFQNYFLNTGLVNPQPTCLKYVSPP